MDAFANTPNTYRAALWAALGGAGKLSRSGQSVIFTRPQLGRSDLSGRAGMARAQLFAAGIDPDSVTPETVAAYEAWADDIYNTRRVRDARILITRIYRARRPHPQPNCWSLEPVNGVRMIDGWGETVAVCEVDCLEVRDPLARNHLGQIGAYRQVPNMDRIAQVIEQIRADWPEYINAPVQDNNAPD